jgi:2'-5' RNA ligase
MSQLLALDVAILLPPEARTRATAVSRTLGGDQKTGVLLDESHFPHITLTQQFIRTDETDAAFGFIDDVLRGQPPLRIRVTGGATSGHSAWMAVEPTDAIAQLHEQLMDALRGLERPAGTAAAFYEGDARVGDVAWVTGYRLKSSLRAYTPHVTLGQAADAPAIEPFSFDATTIAACHLGRFCSCRRVLRSWELI